MLPMDLSDYELTVYHSNMTRSTRVVWVAEELGLSHLRIERVHLKAGEQREPGFLSVNPMGAVPALRIASRTDPHIATTMTESSGIVTFLAEATASLHPPNADIVAHAVYHRFCAFAIATIDPLLWDIRMHEQLLPQSAAVPAIASRARAAFTAKVVPTLDIALASSHGPWLTGTHFTAADLLVGYSLFWASYYDGLLDDTPRLRAYLE
eukprot:IDg5831t1